MLSLNIKTTDIALEMRTDPGRADASFEQPSGRGKYVLPQNDLTVTPVEVKIDSSPCREAMGMYTNARLAQKNAAEGREKLSSGIARVMQEARQVMKNGAKSDAIVDVERQHLFPKQKQVTVASIPGPKITVIPSKIEGEIKPGNDTIESIPGQYHMDYSPSNVNISVGRYSSVKMWTTGNQYSVYA